MYDALNDEFEHLEHAAGVYRIRHWTTFLRHPTVLRYRVTAGCLECDSEHHAVTQRGALRRARRACPFGIPRAAARW